MLPNKMGADLLLLIIAVINLLLAWSNFYAN